MVLIEYVFFGLFLGGLAVGVGAALVAAASPSNRRFFGVGRLLLGSWTWEHYTYDRDNSGKRLIVLTARIAGAVALVALVGLVLTR